MKIERTRYVVMRKNRTEIWCGINQRSYCFKPIDNIGYTHIKTYNTVMNAIRGTGVGWNKDSDTEIVEIKETIEWSNYK